MTTKRLEPIHPGEILEEEFMLPLRLSANALAKAIDVPVTRVADIVRGRRGVTADTALRLSRFFGTSAELWLGLQSEYDLRVAARESGESIVKRISPLKRGGRPYESGSISASGSGSGSGSDSREVREPGSSYAPAPKLRTRDRRRARRASDDRIALDRLRNLDDPIVSAKEFRKRITRRKD